MFFEKLSHSDDHGLLHLPPALDIADRSVKVVNTHPTMTNHHHGLGRSIFLKQTRHYYGHQYFRRNSTNHANASSSRAKGISSKSEFFSSVNDIPYTVIVFVQNIERKCLQGQREFLQAP